MEEEVGNKGMSLSSGPHAGPHVLRADLKKLLTFTGDIYPFRGIPVHE